MSPKFNVPPPYMPGSERAAGQYQEPQANRKTLAAGTAPNATTTVYTVPLRTTTEVTSIHAHNYSGVTVTFDVFVRFNAGTTYHINRTSLATQTSVNQNVIIGGGRIHLGPQWEIRLLASAAASIDYLISGIEFFLPGGGETA